MGKRSAAQCRKALTLKGRYLTITKGGPAKPERIRLLADLCELIEAGQIRSVIDRSFPLEQIVEAHRYVDRGKRMGNVVITVG